MNFVNNYRQAITLAAGATSADLSLPDGTYRLTITDSDTAPTRWEIVDAVVASGTATLTRAQEDTADQLWSVGSVIYCTVTAGLIESILQRLLPAGGTTDQVLAKLSDTDYHVGWVDATAESGFGGASSGRLFVAYTDGADSTSKAAVVDLVTGELSPVSAWDTLLTNLQSGALSYNAAESMLAVCAPGGSNLQLLQDPGFDGFTSTTDVANGSGAVWKQDGTMVVAVKHTDFITPFTFDTGATPMLQPVLGGDGSMPGVSPEVMPVFSPDGGYLYVPTGSGIQRYNGTTFALIDTVLDEQIYQFALSADGSTAAVRSFSFSTYETTIRIVDTSDWSVLATFAGYTQPAVGGDMSVRMAFNPANAQQLAVAVQGTVEGVDAACVVLDHTNPSSVVALSPVADYDAGALDSERVAWSPAGDRLYIACGDALHAYRTANWSYAGTLEGVGSATPVTLP